MRISTASPSVYHPGQEPLDDFRGSEWRSCNKAILQSRDSDGAESTGGFTPLSSLTRACGVKRPLSLPDLVYETMPDPKLPPPDPDPERTPPPGPDRPSLPDPDDPGPDVIDPGMPDPLPA
jgi:hypothetical protein